MAKSEKPLLQRRILEVTRLILLGAEASDIRHHATQQGWDVGDRQLRRYLEAAYQGMAAITGRDRQQLLGLHLMKRKALYARTVKEGDLRTALQILRDEAQLEGLYPASRGGAASAVNPSLAPPSAAPELSWQEQAVQLLRADAPGDFGPPGKLAPTGPLRRLLGPSGQLGTQRLPVLTLQHVNEQLEAAGMYLLTIRKGPPSEVEDSLNRQDLFLAIHVYLYGIGHAGWKLFTENQGLDGQELIAGHYQGELLSILDENLLPLAPDPEMMRLIMQQFDWQLEGPLLTAQSKADCWRAQLQDDPPELPEQ